MFSFLFTRIHLLLTYLLTFGLFFLFYIYIFLVLNKNFLYFLEYCPPIFNKLHAFRYVNGNYSGTQNCNVIHTFHFKSNLPIFYLYISIVSKEVHCLTFSNNFYKICNIDFSIDFTVHTLFVIFTTLFFTVFNSKQQ